MQCGLFPVECGLDVALGFNPHLVQGLKKNFLAVGHRGQLEREMYRIYSLFFYECLWHWFKKIVYILEERFPQKLNTGLYIHEF